MIKLIKITPLNTSKDLYFECEECGNCGSIHLVNSLINTDNQGNPDPDEQIDDFWCPKCKSSLNRDPKN